MGTPSCQVHINLTTVPRQRMHMKTDPRLRQNKPMTEPHEKYCEAAVNCPTLFIQHIVNSGPIPAQHQSNSRPKH